LQKPNVVCIANRDDNSMHIYTQVELACVSLSAYTGITPDELTCDRWDQVGPGVVAPPQSCTGMLFNAWNKADWVFSTIYQITGICPEFPSKKHNATALVPVDHIGSIENPPVVEVCAKGWDGESVYNLTRIQ